MRRSLLIAVLLLAAPVAAGASETARELGYSPAYDRCLAAPSGQSTRGMLSCADLELKVQDARLNRIYGEDMAQLAGNPAGKVALLKAQRAWIAFRDADCAAVLAVTEGTIAPLYGKICGLEHTARRAGALEDLLRP